MIATAVTEARATNSATLLAVSANSDPTGQWYFHRFDVDPTDQLWADYPLLGFNKNWIIISMLRREMSGANVNQRLYIFDKANVYTNGTAHTMIDVDATNRFYIVPAVTYDTNTSTLYCLQTWASRLTLTNNLQEVVTNGVLRLYTISGTASSPTLNLSTNMAPTKPWLGSSGTNHFGRQTNSTQLIATGDDRLQNVIYRNGYLWTTQSILDTNNGTHSAIQWWQLKTNAEPVQVGRLNDSTAVESYAYPSIAVNRLSEVLIGFTRFSSNIYPSAAYAFQSGFDPHEKLRSPFRTYKAGLGVYYRPQQGFNLNRWGDYSATVVDPVNDTDFWTVQEYAANPGEDGRGIFGAEWAQVIVQVPSNNDFANAFQISGSSGTTNGTLFRATAEFEEPRHAGFSASHSIWYQWTAPASGNVELRAYGSLNTFLDTVLAVYTGSSVSSNSLALIAENDSGGRNAASSALTFNAISNVTYRIVVDGKGFSAEAFDATVLTWNQPTAPLIVLDPTNTHHLQGHTLVLTADAIGSPTPLFQWYFNSNILAGATFHNYTNASVQLTNDGYYHLVASNTAGITTSLVAYVKIYTSATASFTNFTIVNHDRLEALVDGIDGYNYTVQATEDFITWTNLQTGVCDFVFTNYFSTNISFRAFRSFY